MSSPCRLLVGQVPGVAREVAEAGVLQEAVGVYVCEVGIQQPGDDPGGGVRVCGHQIADGLAEAAMWAGLAQPFTQGLLVRPLGRLRADLP